MRISTDHIYWPGLTLAHTRFERLYADVCPAGTGSWCNVFGVPPNVGSNVVRGIPSKGTSTAQADVLPVSRLEPGDPAPPFTLRNTGPGIDPLSLEALEADSQIERVLLLFQRDYHCTNCAKQVREVADHYEAFLEAGTLVISILPESYERTRNWQQRHELPFPVLADPDKTVSDEFDQPVRFGFMGEFSDFLGRMPQAVVLDLKGEPTVVRVHRGRSTWDRPDVDGLLEMGSE